MNVIQINNEELTHCVFEKATAHSTVCNTREYNRDLNLSILLSGTGENNVRIVFNTIEGYKEILAAIWGSTEKFILLQGGFSIPAEAIAYVSLD